MVRFFPLFALLMCQTASAASPNACDPIDGVDQVLTAPGVFIGDVHGSAQPPAFLAALACHAVKSGRNVVIAMEYAAEDQSALDAFLNTADETKAITALTSTRYWATNLDGRASAAMRDALLAVHRLARAGQSVKLIGYDIWADESADRDRKGADLVRRIRESNYSTSYWILFGGNVHARKVKGLPFIGAPPNSDDYQPLGYLIRDWHLIHLNVASRGGTTWACIGSSAADCKEINLGPACTTDCPPHPIIRLQAETPAYDGIYEVGKLTASPPLNRVSKN